MSYHSDGHQSSDNARYLPDNSSSHSPPSSSGAATPTSTSAGSSSFLSNSFYSAFGGIMRRLSSDPAGHLHTEGSRHIDHAATFPAPTSHHGGNSHFVQSPSSATFGGNGIDGVYTPPIARSASPLRPPPLEPLTLKGFSPDTPLSARILTPSIAEEIRIMVPERLRIEEDWKLVYSLDQDGASLATLYEKTHKHDEHRIGFVLVVKDQEGGIFGAYLTEHPHPSPHYFGTGECFLWRASLLSPLPPPPSADTDHLTTRSTTIAASPTQPTFGSTSQSSNTDQIIPGLDPEMSTQQPKSPLAVHPPQSPSIRFSAFPYSGVNEYFIYCEAHSLSVGGGDGKYGLWLNDSLDKGISATCLTFGNQPLSDEGEKFGVLGVEVWVIGSRK
ncbi:oxidation resistance protein 1 [Sporothrix eucalyptigena]|uniref:Oxidation resistance protein 1 n=1 Tax=Sporothrix eucalyptigena TaxID=1812306 RepID=A0ABP0CW56_9PEZI